MGSVPAVPEDRSLLVKDPLKIYAIPGDEGACGTYRVIQPMDLLGKAGHEVCLIGKGVTPTEGIKFSETAQVLVFQRPANERVMNINYLLRVNPKQMTVFEHDDHPWDIDPWNKNYVHHGTQEVKATLDGKEFWLWKDGVEGFDIKRNIRENKLFNTAMAYADIITTTTPYLAKEFLSRVKELRKGIGGKFPGLEPRAYALPNCLNLDLWRPLNLQKPPGEVRVMWMGGASHASDWWHISPTLVELCKKHPNVKLVIAGVHYAGTTKEIDPKQLEVHDEWTDLSAHPYRMAALGADIGICPLEDNRFNRCKSELKYTEYSALGIPTVASDCIPYSPVIEHGKTGYLAKTQAEWVEHLSALVKNESLREEVGANARKWVEENRDAAKEAGKWEQTYREALKDKAKALKPKPQDRRPKKRK